MDLKLEIDRADLLVQETTSGLIRFKNTTAHPVTIPDPDHSLEGPILRVTNLATGRSEDYRSTTRARKTNPHFIPQPGGPPVKHFGPGQEFAVHLDLLGWTGVLLPGKYSLCAVLQHENLLLESASLELEVRFAEGWLATEAPVSSGEPQWASAWGPLNGKGGSLVLVRTMQFTSFAQVFETVRVHAASTPVRPIVSTPPNGGIVQGHWVAWLENQTLVAAFEELGVVKVKPIALKLPDGRAQLFSPILCDEALADTPGEGLVTLFRRPAVATTGELLAIRLPAKSKPEVAATVPIPASPPIWNRAAQLSNEQRYVVWMTNEKGTVHLHQVTWPRRGAPALTKSMASWPGGWVGAAAALDFDDVLQGASLMMAPRTEPPGLLLIGWRIGPDGDVESDEPLRTEWQVEQSIANCLVRVDGLGQAFGVLTDGEGRVFLLDPQGQLTPLPPGSPRSQPIDLVFTTAGDPIVIYTDETKGFRYVNGDGSAYPSW